MRLRANRPQVARIAAIDVTVDFAEGDEIRTEISRKFTQHGFERSLGAAGMQMRGWFTDEAQRFALALAAPRA